MTSSLAPLRILNARSLPISPTPKKALTFQTDWSTNPSQGTNKTGTSCSSTRPSGTTRLKWRRLPSVTLKYRVSAAVAKVIIHPPQWRNHIWRHFPRMVSSTNSRSHASKFVEITKRLPVSLASEVTRLACPSKIIQFEGAPLATLFDNQKDSAKGQSASSQRAVEDNQIVDFAEFLVVSFHLNKSCAPTRQL